MRSLLLLLLACCGCHDSTKMDAKVPVGALSLHILCRGEGTPTVVFDSGLGNDARAWSSVQPEVAKLTKVCAYDRAGTGSSSPAPRPHPNRQMAEELHALLKSAKIPGPYVLVGHSMGGMNVQLLLDRYPDSVAGMVLVDASPEPPLFEQFPRAELAEFEKNIGKLEGLDMKTLLGGYEELRQSKPSLGNKPLVVLVAGRATPEPFLTEAQARDAFLKRQHAQKPLVDLSTNGVLVTARNSTHHIPHESPEIVVEAVKAVVDSSRTGSKVDASAIQ